MYQYVPALGARGCAKLAVIEKPGLRDRKSEPPFLSAILSATSLLNQVWVMIATPSLAGDVLSKATDRNIRTARLKRFRQSLRLSCELW